MVDALHTPGPWVHCHGPLADVRAGDSVSGKKIANTMFAEIKTKGPNARARYEERLAECRANARLIAAAPDLLKACSDWIEWLTPNAPWREDAADHEARMLDAMRAAIAKATATHSTGEA